jgi:hypothetical protein
LKGEREAVWYSMTYEELLDQEDALKEYRDNLADEVWAMLIKSNRVPLLFQLQVFSVEDLKKYSVNYLTALKKSLLGYKPSSTTDRNWWDEVLDTGSKVIGILTPDILVLAYDIYSHIYQGDFSEVDFQVVVDIVSMFKDCLDPDTMAKVVAVVVGETSPYNMNGKLGELLGAKTEGLMIGASGQLGATYSLSASIAWEKGNLAKKTCYFSNEFGVQLSAASFDFGVFYFNSTAPYTAFGGPAVSENFQTGPLKLAVSVGSDCTITFAVGLDVLFEPTELSLGFGISETTREPSCDRVDLETIRSIFGL